MATELDKQHNLPQSRCSSDELIGISLHLYVSRWNMQIGYCTYLAKYVSILERSLFFGKLGQFNVFELYDTVLLIFSLV